MKALVFSMLAMAAMVSCTSESDPINDGGNEKVEIKLNAGIEATTKAAVSSTIPDDGLKVNFLRAADAATATWSSGTTLFATIAKEGGITFNTSAEDNTEIKQYYNTVAANKSWLAGYYTGSLTGTPTNEKVTFTITGDDDILATPGLSGDKATAFKNFEFEHMLSQVEIILQGDVAAQKNFGKITKVELTGLATELELTLGATATINKTAAALEDEVITVYDDATGIDLSTAGTKLTNLPMIWKTGTDIGIKVTSAATAVPSTLTAQIANLGFEKGKKHIITLNFKEKITATASIKAWENSSNAGTGEVE